MLEGLVQAALKFSDQKTPKTRRFARSDSHWCAPAIPDDDTGRAWRLTPLALPGRGMANRKAMA